MLKTMLDVDPNSYSDVYFKGTVIANNDSGEVDLKYTERIKVQVPGLFDSTDPAQLPWCIPFKGRLFGSKVGQGVFSVPSIGSIVTVVLQQGDPHNPAYIGSLLLEANTVAEFLVNYPNRYGLKDPAGNIIYIDTTAGQVTIHLEHKSGTQIHIDDTGNVTLTVAGTTQVNSTGTMTVTAPLIKMN